VVGEGKDLTEATQFVQRLHPNVVVLDTADLNEQSEVEIARVAARTRIVILASNESYRFVRTMLRAGVSGFVLKSSSPGELLLAIRYASRGRSFLDPSLAGRIVLEDRRKEVQQQQRLSERELEVLRLLLQGHTNTQIARQLRISVKTIETYRSRIYNKLELHSRADLMQYALDAGLISVAEPDAVRLKFRVVNKLLQVILVFASLLGFGVGLISLVGSSWTLVSLQQRRAPRHSNSNDWCWLNQS
jgi:two-component system response regulator NreC